MTACNGTPVYRLIEGVRKMLANIDYLRQAPVWDPASISDATRDWFAYLGGSGLTKEHS